MSYVRKTRDEGIAVQQYTGRQYGWETVYESKFHIPPSPGRLGSTTGAWKDARSRLREYRENQPEYPVRLKLVRVMIEREAQQ